MTAVTIVRRDQARTAGSFVTMEGNRFAVDFHRGMAFDNHRRTAVSFLGAGDFIAHAGGRLAINQVVTLCGNNFAAMVCGVTEYNDSFHRSGLPDKGERVSPEGGAIQGH